MAEETNSNNKEQTNDRSESRSRSSSSSRSRGRRSRRGQRRGHVCQFCADQIDHVDYKDVDLLQDFVSRSGRILPRRKTGTCAKHQRMVAKAVKRARHLALLPYSAKHTYS